MRRQLFGLHSHFSSFTLTLCPSFPTQTQETSPSILSPEMAGGKKAKRGGTAKQRQALNASPPIQRNTAFIETASTSERVFPHEVRNTIYRCLLLGRNVKEQRDSEVWNDKGWAYRYCFEVNVLRANKAVYAEGERRDPPRPSRPPADLYLLSEQQEKCCMGKTHSLSCRLRSIKSATVSGSTPFRWSLRIFLLSTASPGTVST